MAPVPVPVRKRRLVRPAAAAAARSPDLLDPGKVAMAGSNSAVNVPVVETVCPRGLVQHSDPDSEGLPHRVPQALYAAAVDEEEEQKWWLPGACDDARILVVSRPVAAQTDFDTPAVALAVVAEVFVEVLQAEDGLGAHQVEVPEAHQAGVRRETRSHLARPGVALEMVGAARNVRAGDDTGLAVNEAGACHNVLLERGLWRLYARERGRLVLPPRGF